MREIREYNMNGTIILGVDNGYGNVKGFSYRNYEV